jgi:hypothetical protein
MPLSVSRYVYLSTLLGIFSGVLFIYLGSTIFFFYIIMLSNLLLMWGFLRPLIFPKWFAWLMIYLAASSFIGIARGTDTVFLAGKQIAAIGLSALYFANFFHLEDNEIDRAWATYAKLAYRLTLLALAMWVVQCWLKHGFVRLHGITAEPSSYCVLTLPAYYWYAHQWWSKGKHRKEVLWIALGVALSVSSDGYLAVIFGLVLLFGKKMTSLALSVAIASGLAISVYMISPQVHLRVDDTFSALVENDVSGTNLSTYALISNMFVTGRVLEVHPLLGNGLGSHVKSGKKYIEDVPGEQIVEASGWDAGANLHDASSLTLRTLSELGISGFIAILFFILHFRVKGNSDRAAISGAILTVFFQKLLRGGGYANPEQFFFILIYMLNYRYFRLEKRDSMIATQEHSPGFSMLQNP